MNSINGGLPWRHNTCKEESELYILFFPDVFSEEDLFQAVWSHSNS